YGWHILYVDGHDVKAVEEAIRAAQAVTDKPSLIVTKTTIGWGTPKAGTSAAHSDAMGEDAIKALRETIGWPDEDFYVPDDVRSFFAQRKEELAKESAAWKDRFEAWSKANPDLRKEWDAAFSGAVP